MGLWRSEKVTTIFIYAPRNRKAMGSLTQYMRKELIFYIKQEYDRGVPMARIRKSLMEGGHHQNLVKEAMRALKRTNYNLIKALNEPIKSDLDKELYFNIMNSLIKYAEHQLASGKSEKEVKKVLSDYGHSEEIIEKALKGVKDEIPGDSKVLMRLDIGMVLGTVLVILFSAGGANEPLHLVVGAFTPTLLTIAMLNLQSFSKGGKGLAWVYAPFFAFAFLLLGETGVLGHGYNLLGLAMLNLIISLAYTYVKSIRNKDVQEYLDNLKASVATDSDKEVKPKDKKKKSKKSDEKKR